VAGYFEPVGHCGRPHTPTLALDAHKQLPWCFLVAAAPKIITKIVHLGVGLTSHDTRFRYPYGRLLAQTEKQSYNSFMGDYMNAPCRE
jgi:hypothetical protein